MSMKRLEAKWKELAEFNRYHDGKYIAVLSPSGKQVWMFKPPNPTFERMSWAEFLKLVR